MKQKNPILTAIWWFYLAMAFTGFSVSLWAGTIDGADSFIYPAIIWFGWMITYPSDEENEEDL